MRKRYGFENIPLCEWKERHERKLRYLVKAAIIPKEQTNVILKRVLFFEDLMKHPTQRIKIKMSAGIVPVSGLSHRRPSGYRIAAVSSVRIHDSQTRGRLRDIWRGLSVLNACLLGGSLFISGEVNPFHTDSVASIAKLCGVPTCALIRFTV